MTKEAVSAIEDLLDVIVQIHPFLTETRVQELTVIERAVPYLQKKGTLTKPEAKQLRSSIRGRVTQAINERGD